MDRRDILLATFAAGGRNATFSPSQVQRMLFLVDREAAEYVGGPHFDFVAHDYGPLDRGVYDVLDELWREGLVEQRNPARYREFALTPKGYKAGHAVLDGFPDRVGSFLRRLVEWVRNLTFEQLAAAILKYYPDMAVNILFRS